jgi:hypothetical protein
MSTWNAGKGSASGGPHEGGKHGIGMTIASQMTVMKSIPTNSLARICLFHPFSYQLLQIAEIHVFGIVI